jgi:release factor glutamine methyltransferase
MPALQRRVNVLIFNPPYVPTPPEELQGCGIERSWAGGLRGREVLDLLLPRISDFLAPNGIFYLITVDDNDPAEIAAILSQQGLSSSVVLRTKAKNEKLQVMRFCFSQQ